MKQNDIDTKITDALLNLMEKKIIKAFQLLILLMKLV